MSRPKINISIYADSLPTWKRWKKKRKTTSAGLLELIINAVEKKIHGEVFASLTPPVRYVKRLAGKRIDKKCIKNKCIM